MVRTHVPGSKAAVKKGLKGTLRRSLKRRAAQRAKLFPELAQDLAAATPLENNAIHKTNQVIPMFLFMFV